MRVIINISNRLGGGAFQVAISFVMELLAKDFGRNCYFAGNREILAALENSGVAVDNSRFFEIDNRYYALIHLRLGRIERMVKPDLVFTVFGPAYWRPKAKHLVGFANPYYLNMQGPFIERLSPLERFILKFKKNLHVLLMRREADAIVTETEYCTKGYLKLFKNIERGFTVSNTYGLFFDRYIGEPKRAHQRFTVATICKYYRHKNLEIINAITDRMRAMHIQDIRFIVTLDEKDYSRIFAHNEYVHNIGVVATKDCPEVYLEADAMLLPSLAECFSASYPEAMIMKTPIITSDLPFAHAICGDAAIYVNPMDAQAITKAILELKACNGRQEELIERGLERVKAFPSSHERTEAYIDICCHLLEDGQLKKHHVAL